jgi:hypothetical protein
VTVAFTWNGLRALGVDEASLATFPEEFRQGMVARAEMLGDTGLNHPNNWVGGLASPNLHAIVILFAADEAQRERSIVEHKKFIAQCKDVEVLSSPCHHAVSIIPMARQYIKISQRIDDRRAAGEIHRIPIFAIRQGSREYLHWLAIELVQ